MIIYGSKSTLITTAIVPESCSSCGTHNSVEMAVFQKYGHVFWIPFIPTGKTGVTQCSHCKKVLEKKEFSSSLNLFYQNLKSTSKTPLWTFTGLALLVGLIVWGKISGEQHNEEKAAMVATPQKGDIYEIKTNEGEYTLYKVASLKGDTVFVLASQFATNKYKGLNELKSKGDEAFVPISSPITKSELKKMLEKGEIMDVDRKE